MSKEAAAKHPLKQAPLRTPGQGLDERLHDLAFDEAFPVILWPACAVALTIGSAAQLLLGRSLIVIYVFLAVMVVALAWAAVTLRRVVRQSKAIKLGRAGERHVGQLLQSLDLPGTRVFHDIPAGAFNLDHVVVCDRGIYVVETKTWRKRGRASIQVRDGQVHVNGRRTARNPIDQAAAAARWLSEKLHAETGFPHRCQAVVVFPGWWVTYRDPPGRALAWVLEPKALLKWIRNDAPSLDEPAVRRIENVIAKHVRSQMPGLEG